MLFGWVVLLAFPGRAIGQSSPPGLGEGNTASWFAVGLKQQLDPLRKMNWVGYVGMGRKSGPDGNLPYRHPAILVVNQEFSHLLHRHWQYSLGLSYREQHEYARRPPYEHAEPGKKEEIRIYGRLTYLLSRSKWKFSATLRQEGRKFYTPDLVPWEEDLQLRTRTRIQATRYVDQRKRTKLIASAEQLFATSRELALRDWSPLAYTESRFSLFLAYHPEELPFEFSVGYMNNLLGRSAPSSIHYIALSVVWQNPFGLRGGESGVQQPDPDVEQF